MSTGPTILAFIPSTNSVESSANTEPTRSVMVPPTTVSVPPIFVFVNNSIVPVPDASNSRSEFDTVVSIRFPAIVKPGNSTLLEIKILPDSSILRVLVQALLPVVVEVRMAPSTEGTPRSGSVSDSFSQVYLSALTSVLGTFLTRPLKRPTRLLLIC